MEFKVRFKKDGRTIVEVTDREGEECIEIKQITKHLGEEESDEIIGPECDKVEEIMGGGGSF